jgi:hypothetical protein
MLKVLFRVKCIDASDSYDYLELGKEYGVSRVSAPNSIGLVNTRGKDKGEITPNEEEVYHIEGMPAEWDASRFEVINDSTQPNKYAVLACFSGDDQHGVVSTHKTKAEAQLALFKCQEGDDKNDPIVYTIEEMN